jgi:hypothetical protein
VKFLLLLKLYLICGLCRCSTENLKLPLSSLFDLKRGGLFFPEIHETIRRPNCRPCQLCLRLLIFPPRHILQRRQRAAGVPDACKLAR